nr:zinc finger, CCHC-type, retrotransposon Gag domain protein [Tanacetum cinerariifolium]
NALPNLTASLRTQITNNIRNGAGPSGGDAGDAIPHGIHVWIERFTKLKPLAFWSAATPAEAEDWIMHMEKLFQVLGCLDNFKTRLAAFKLEGDALRWWKAHLRTQGQQEIRGRYDQGQHMYRGHQDRVLSIGVIRIEVMIQNDRIFGVRIKGLLVKENQEKDKTGSKPDKNRKRGEAGKSIKQLQ